MTGLPKYVVLRSKSVGKYVHYLWNDEEFGDYYKCLGCKEEMDPTSPFVKLEVVNAPSDPPNFVHLRCSYSNKYLKLLAVNGGLLAVSATADEPDFENGSTLFLAVFPDDEDPNTVGFTHVVTEFVVTHLETQFFVSIFADDDAKLADDNGVVCAQYREREDAELFEFAPWVSFEETVKAYEAEIEKVKVETAAVLDEYEDTAKGEDGEIRMLKERMESDWGMYQDKLKAKDGEVQNLIAQIRSTLDQPIESATN
ncbi:hypothetical protein LINGRAHAP2_LOCUS15206 [Linum grandiflorum]